jgi:archaellum biogenesis ATPase FlaH
VDVAAFRTLINPDDDEYLRSHLATAALRRVWRARILAIQQYLRWMADDCRVVLLLVHAQESNREQDFELQSLVRQAVRLRFTAMALWLFPLVAICRA